VQIEISGIHISITEEIDKHIKKKLSKINKYFHRIISVRVILKAEKENYFTEINVIANGFTIHANAVNPDLYISIETAVDKIIRQARKHKDKLKSHRLRDASEKAPLLNSLSATPDDTEYKIIHVSKEIAKPMTVDEAIMQLKMRANKFFVFLNSNTNQVNVIYRKENGNFGLIEPQI